MAKIKGFQFVKSYFFTFLLVRRLKQECAWAPGEYCDVVAGVGLAVAVGGRGVLEAVPEQLLLRPLFRQVHPGDRGSVGLVELVKALKGGFKKLLKAVMARSNFLASPLA